MEATSDRAIVDLPQELRPLARWIDEQHRRGGLVGRNAATGALVPESVGEYFYAWSLLRELEKALQVPRPPQPKRYICQGCGQDVTGRAHCCLGRGRKS